MKNRKYFIVLFILIIVCMGICLLIKFNKHLNVDNVENFRINREEIFKKLLEREIVYDDEIIFIGSNQKELENNYFDIKIDINDLENVKIYINKLFENYSNEKLYDEEYVNQFVDYIINVLNLYIDKFELKEIILNNYLRLRSSNSIEEFETEKVNLNKVSIKCKTENNMLLIEIGRI